MKFSQSHLATMLVAAACGIFLAALATEETGHVFHEPAPKNTDGDKLDDSSK